jgi:mannosyltransferase
MTASQTISARPPHALKQRRGQLWSYIALAMVILGLALRWFGLAKLSLEFDEGYTAWLSHQSASEIIRLVKADTAPPLYYISLHYWTHAFHNSEWGLRSFSAALASASLIFVWLLARQILRKPWAVAGAMGIYALSYMQLVYAQEARAYALTSFFSIASFYGLHQYLRTSRRLWLPWIAATVAGQIYAHNMMLAYLPALGLAWLILPSAHSVRRRVGEGIAVVFAAFIAFLPWAMILRQQVKLVHSTFWVPFPTAEWIVGIFARLAGLGSTWAYRAVLKKLHIPVSELFLLSNIPRLTVILLALVVVLALLLPLRRKRREAAALAIYALLPPMAVAIYSCMGTPIFMDKIFLASTNILPILLLIPAAWARPISLRPLCITLAGLFLFISFVTTVSFEATRHKEDWRGAGAYLRQMPDTPRVILCVSEDGQLPLDFYYHHRPNETETGAPAGFFDLNPPRAMRHVDTDADALAPIANVMKYPEIVLVECKEGIADPNGLILKFLSRQCKEIDEKKLVDITIYRFQPNSKQP